MSLAFGNLTNEDIWVAYMFLSRDVCRGEGRDWQAIGWFQVPAVSAHRPPHHPKGPSAEGSHTQTIYANDLRDVNNRYWYYYAQNASGIAGFGLGQSASRFLTRRSIIALG